MSWTVIKESIKKDLSSRGLKKLELRLNALENIEFLLNKNYPDYITNPIKKFNEIDKNDFKNLLSKHKEKGNLNSAERSVINEIYYRL